MATTLRLTKDEIEAKIARLKKSASNNPDDAEDILADIEELKAALKSGNFKGGKKCEGLNNIEKSLMMLEGKIELSEAQKILLEGVSVAGTLSPALKAKAREKGVAIGSTPSPQQIAELYFAFSSGAATDESVARFVSGMEKAGLTIKGLTAQILNALNKGGDAGDRRKAALSKFSN